jgi:hypothetical protein
MGSLHKSHLFFQNWGKNGYKAICCECQEGQIAFLKTSRQMAYTWQSRGLLKELRRGRIGMAKAGRTYAKR